MRSRAGSSDGRSEVTEHGAPPPGIGDLLFPAINFAIFAYVLVRFLAGPIREYFRDRTDRLRSGLLAGKRAQQQAHDLRAQLDKDARELPGVLERLKADLLATAEEARTALLAQGRQAAERIRADATLVADQEAHAAERAVRAEIVEEAIRQATTLIRDTVTTDDQTRFVREFVESARQAP
jgi:F-type H+-transporting ATPase subunit b